MSDIDGHDRLCKTCKHRKGVHTALKGCVGYAVFSEMGAGGGCTCRAFAPNEFFIRLVVGDGIVPVTFNGRDITHLLSRAEVVTDHEFHTTGLRLSLRPDAVEIEPQTVNELRQIADEIPPYVTVMPEGMSGGQWVLRLSKSPTL